MEKIEKSSGASAAFSSKALGMAGGGKAKAPAAAQAGDGFALPEAKGAAGRPREPEVGKGGGTEAAAGPVFATLASESAQRERALAGAPNASLDLSPESRAMSGGGRPAARTVDAGAPAGSGKRIRAYGEAQQALAPKGGGFDGSA